MPDQEWFTDDEKLEASDTTVTDDKDGKETQDSSTEKPNETEAPAVEDKNTEEEIPFHKHPRFKAITSENRELKSEIENIKSTLEQFQQQYVPTKTDATQVEVPQWFITAFGDNPEAYQALQQFEASREEQLKQSIKAELNAEKSAKKEQDNAIKTFIDTEITTLKEEGNQFDANELKKVVLEHKLFDSEGKLNFRAGLAILKATKPDTTEAKKEIANKTNPVNGTTPTKPDVVTPGDLRKASSALDFLKRLN